MMLAGTIWQRELVEFAQRRSALVIKLAFPLVFGVPLVIAAPPVYAAVTLTMLIAIIGALGAGAVLTRERQSGLTLRGLDPRAPERSDPTLSNAAGHAGAAVDRAPLD